MFIIFSKEKIKTYLITLTIVVSLFIMPVIIRKEQAIETGSEIIESNQILNNSNTIIE